MNDPFQFIWALIQFQAAALVLVAVLVAGYVLKLIPQVNNQRIPLYVIALSVVFYLILCVPPKDTFADVFSTLRYLVMTAILGAFVGMLAWLFHAQALKRITDKISQFNQNKTQP